MTLQALLDLFRELSDDQTPRYRVSDALAIGYANEGQIEAVRRTRMFEDSTTTATCTIAVVAGTAIYNIDPRVIFIRRVKLASHDCRLPKVSMLDADRAAPGWEAAPSGDVLAWMPWGNQQIRLLNPPAVNDTINLTVIREPLADMVLADVANSVTAVDPEIPRRYQDRLVDWMLYRAFMARDKQDKYNPAEAKERLALFEAEFGPRSSAIDETWIARKHGYDEDEGLF